MPPTFWIYLLAGNLVCLFSFGWDKWSAVRGSRRTPEIRLLFSTALLGAGGAWLGVKLLRHKSSKRSFLRKLWLATAANGVVVWYAAKLTL